jgi:putative inorganic carbon (hco3(-)) transporter
VRSIFFISFFLFVLVTAARAPFVAGLLYIWVDLLVPQRVAYGFIEQIPLAMISGGAAILFYFLFDKKERVHLGAQWVCLVGFFVWITINTLTIALLPEFAWPKWQFAYKTILFAAFMPFMFRSRVRLESMLLTIVACVGVVAFSLALKTIIGGGAYGSTRIWGGVNATVLGESSTFALAASAMIPFIYALGRHTVLLPLGKYRKWLTYGGIAFIVVAVIGSYARTGLICLSVLVVIAFWQSRNKIVFAVLAAIIGTAAVPLLPENWVTRMNTIQTAETEGSASGRIAVWKWTLDFVAENPLGGGFDSYRLNEIEMTVQDPARPNDPTAIARIKVRSKAYHSIYFEVLGEMGWPGLLLLGSALILSLTKSWKISRAHKRGSDTEWLGAFAGANFVSTLLVMIGGTFVGIAFSAITYYPIVISLVLMNLHRKTAAGMNAKSKPVAPDLAGWGAIPNAKSNRAL